MIRKNTLHLLLLLAAFSLTSCSGIPKTGGGGGGNGTATVSFTIAAVPFTPPPGTSILSFAVTLSGVQLTPASGGAAVAIPLNATTYVVDLTRLQSDSAFLGQVLAKIPAGTYNAVTVGVTSAVVTYCTDLGGAVGCDTGSVAQITAGLSTPTTSSFSATFSNGQETGVQIQFNIGKALTVNANTQVVSAVNLAATNVLTASVLAPTSTTSSLATGQLDFVEDVTGVVTAVSATAVTVQTSTHGSITAVPSASSLDVTNCVTTSAACAPAVGQLASIDTALNSAGTFALLEYDPIAPTSSDWIEGIVPTTPSSSTQFQIVTNDIFLASAGSLIGTNLSLGAPVQVTLTNVKPFLVDSKGFLVVATPFTSGATDATDIIPGQTVAVHVTKFTPKNGNVPAAATVDTVVLRFTRVAGSITSVPGPTLNIQSFPPFFGPAANIYEVQLNTASPSTNYDGVSGAAGLTVGNPASIRALYFGSTFVPALSAAKVRQ